MSLWAFAALVCAVGMGSPRAATGLEVVVQDELGHPLKGIVVQVEIPFREDPVNTKLTLVLQDGAVSGSVRSHDGEADGRVVFSGERWERFAYKGAVAMVKIQARGHVSVNRELTLQAEGNMVEAVLPFALLVEGGASKGFSLSAGGKELAADGGVADPDGKRDGRLYATLPWPPEQGNTLDLTAISANGKKLANTVIRSIDHPLRWNLSTDPPVLEHREGL